jgi:hypothetical protein
MLIAFQKLKHTPEYKNAVNWTIKAENESQADGELWFGFAAGWNAHASHTAALREKAEALVVVLDAGIVKANQFSLGVRRTDELLERLTALKAELDKEQR